LILRSLTIAVEVLELQFKSGILLGNFPADLWATGAYLMNDSLNIYKNENCFGKSYRGK